MTGSVPLRRAPAVIFAVLLLSAAALLCPTVANAESYPYRAVKIIVPFPPGGPLDTTARLLAEKLATSLKQPFVVENRPGAAGNLGTEAVARAPADGYTLLIVLDTPLTVNPFLYPKLGFDPVRDFTPISAVASFSLTLVVHPSVPVKSVSEFVAYAGARKDKPLLYGSGGGPGNPGHLAMEYFRQQAGFGGTHVPYKGNAEVVMGLVGGQIEAGFLATPGVLSNVQDGHSRPSRSPVPVAHPSQLISRPSPRAAIPALKSPSIKCCLRLPASRNPSGQSSSARSGTSFGPPNCRSASARRQSSRSRSTGAEADALLKRVAQQWQVVIRAANIRME